MSSEYFCKVALARASNRSSRQLNKQANAAMNFKKAITGPLGGMLAGAGVAGGVGLHSIKGLQQELANKAIIEAANAKTIQGLKESLRLANAPIQEKVVNSISNTANELAKVHGPGAGGVLDRLLLSEPANTAINALNRANDYTSGAYTRLAETLQGHPFFSLN